MGIFIFLILSPMFLYADSDDYYVDLRMGYYSYSHSWEFNKEASNDYHSLGIEFVFRSPHHFFKDDYESGIHILGFKYKWGDDDKVININYIIGNTFAGSFDEGHLIYGLGSNVSLNINSGTFGFSPQIDLAFWDMLKLTISYRYNIYSNKRNSHEITGTVGLFSLIIFLKSVM